MKNNKKKTVLFIHPPLTKPCEPPAAPAYLAGALEAHGVSCTVCDFNIEGLYYLLDQKITADDTWSKRACKNIERNLAALQQISTYENKDRYRRAAADINRVLEIIGRDFDLELSLSNYQDTTLSPLKSSDLRIAAEQFHKNIYFPYFSKRLGELLQENHFEYIGFSINYLSQALCAFAMIGYLKACHPKIQSVVGGGLVTTWLSHRQWHNSFDDLIDICIGGRGEGPLLELFGRRQSKTCLPDYHKLRKNNYLSPGFILPYTSSTGCLWKKCTFCPETSENNPYVHLPPNRTVSELETLSSATRPSLIHLLDNSLSPSTLQAISRTGLAAPWYGFARFDNLLTNKEFCLKLRASGCVMLKLGLESGDQNVLDAMNKGINLKCAEQVLENLHAAGIATYIYLLFGTPSEDRDGAERTLAFVEKHHQAIDFLNLAIFNLPLCSKENGKLEVVDFYEGDLSIYQNFNHPKGWNRREIRKFLDTRFKRRPAIAAILKNDPPFFTSNHAPFFAQNFKQN